MVIRTWTLSIIWSQLLVKTFLRVAHMRLMKLGNYVADQFNQGRCFNADDGYHDDADADDDHYDAVVDGTVDDL